MRRSVASVLFGRSRSVRRPSTSITFKPMAPCQATYYFVLDFQEVGSLDIESFCPKLCSSVRVDELCVDAEPLPVGKDAAGQRVTHVEFAADPPHVADATLVGERGVARNNETSR